MWAKVVSKSDWGSITVYASAGSVDYPIDQPKYHIQFPDLTSQEITIEWQKLQDSYTDQGHTYQVWNDIPFIQLNHHGIKIPIKLHESGCKLWIQ